MLFMVIERYKNRDAKAVYSRFKEKGRMMPEGLKYLGSWVEDNFDRCFQLMECDDPPLFEQWLVHWEDLGDYEIVHVVSSAEAADAPSPGARSPIWNCDCFVEENLVLVNALSSALKRGSRKASGAFKVPRTQRARRRYSFSLLLSPYPGSRLFQGFSATPTAHLCRACYGSVS
jgi:Protein of unknown function (DUF3303)